MDCSTQVSEEVGTEQKEKEIKFELRPAFYRQAGCGIVTRSDLRCACDVIEQAELWGIERNPVCLIVSPAPCEPLRRRN